MGAYKAVVTLAALALAAGSATAQPRVATRATPAAEPGFVLEVVGGIGMTVVDMDKWAGTTALDWNTTNHAFTGRLFFLRLGPAARLGVEVGYQYLFWYSVPGLGSTPYRYESAPTHVAGVVRLPLGGRLTLDAGAGAHFFDGATKVGVLGALGYHVRLGPKLTLPIQLRADVIMTDPVVIPVALNAGLGFHF